MTNLSEEINDILSHWDPLEVGEYISTDEYRGFIPQIIKNIKHKEKLINCLEDILINHLEVGYDKNNIAHQNDLLKVVVNIMFVDLKNHH